MYGYKIISENRKAESEQVILWWGEVGLHHFAESSKTWKRNIVFDRHLGLTWFRSNSPGTQYKHHVQVDVSHGFGPPWSVPLLFVFA